MLVAVEILLDSDSWREVLTFRILAGEMVAVETEVPASERVIVSGNTGIELCLL